MSTRRSRYGRAYRKKLGNGLVPPGDRAWCVHCDEYRWEPNPDYDPDKPHNDLTNNEERSVGRVPCNCETCRCSCHTKQRKPKCLCAVVKLDGPWDSPLGCCMDCDCYCHRAEEKEHKRTRAEREILWKAELDRRDKECRGDGFPLFGSRESNQGWRNRRCVHRTNAANPVGECLYQGTVFTPTHQNLTLKMTGVEIATIGTQLEENNMGIFDNIFGKRKKAVAPDSACCKCFSTLPGFHCGCSCHRVDDAEYWETIAYAWLCDIEDAAGREQAWRKFFQAYPEWFVEELCEDFWHRIRCTEWHHKHHHEYHHQPYNYGECD